MKKPRTVKRSSPHQKEKLYFTKVHEDAIIEYALTKDPKVRQDLYRRLIGPAFNEMVNKIVFTYKFNNLPNIDDLKEECKIWITTILDKFDSSKGSKAFSYFSVITKNWFIHKVKKVSRQNKKEIFLDDAEHQKEFDYDNLIIHNETDNIRETQEFWNHLWTEIEQWKKLELKSNEKKVLDAISILLESPDSIEIFNKKAIYLYVREITGLNTKQVVNNLNKIRQKYKEFRKDWNNGEI
jgi:DNA-directed RNA polymerase specialized sigma24 family protein